VSTTPAVKRVARMLHTRYGMSPLTASSCATAAVRTVNNEQAPADVASELASLEDWCTEHAAQLPGPTGQNDGRRTAATDAVWDVIDEIRRRRGGGAS
jgi:hypothetical protein